MTDPSKKYTYEEYKNLFDSLSKCPSENDNI